MSTSAPNFFEFASVTKRACTRHRAPGPISMRVTLTTCTLPPASSSRRPLDVGKLIGDLAVTTPYSRTTLKTLVDELLMLMQRMELTGPDGICPSCFAYLLRTILSTSQTGVHPL